MSLTQRMLAREKGYARLLLPLASQNEGDDQDESPLNKEDRRLVTYLFNTHPNNRVRGKNVRKMELTVLRFLYIKHVKNFNTKLVHI